MTIYQMELPFNTTISRNLLAGANNGQAQVAEWSAKRRWVEEAFAALERAGYIIGSAYTAVKNPATKFIYRDRLWQGADMVGLGVASFGYVNGVHMQNLDTFEPYCDASSIRSDSARPGTAAVARGAVHPRVRAPAEARIDRAVAFPVEIRRRSARALQGSTVRACRRGLPDDEARPRHPQPRGLAARGQPAAKILPGKAQDGQIHVNCRLLIADC